MPQPSARAKGSKLTHIAAMEQRMRADDGHLGPLERVRLDGALDRSSAHIYHARHDTQTR